MNFQLIGVNHKTAPVEVRERLAIPESRLPEALKRFTQHPGVDEGLILSTCNRVELLAQTRNGSADLRAFLRDYFQLEPAELEPHLYEYREHDAIRHLFRVTSSLDSMVVGEAQILGQVKEAYATARAVGAVHSQLDLLLTRAFAVAKRVRTETAVGSSAVSVASVAVELAKKIFGSLQRQARVPGRSRKDERTGRAPSACPWRGVDLRRQSHLRPRHSPGPEVRRSGHRVQPALRHLRPRRHRHYFDRRSRTPSSAASMAKCFSAAARTVPCSSSTSPSRATSIRR